MSRYHPEAVPEIAQLREYLDRELRRIATSLDFLLGGEVENTTADPGRDTPLFRYSDGAHDLGAGPGFYVRMGTQWYLLEKRPVAGLHPPSLSTRLLSSAPTLTLV